MTIDLGADRAGLRLTDLFAGGRFPTIGHDGLATLSLGPRGFFWLAINGAESTDG